MKSRTFVVADLPGLIEGAHKGAGLGTRFLRHVERTRLLVHLVDTSDASLRDPIQDFEIICNELAAFSPALAEKPMIVVASKLDMTTDHTKLDSLRDFCKERGLEFHAISSATGEGIAELIYAMADALDRIPRQRPDSDTEEDLHERAMPRTEIENEHNSPSPAPERPASKVKEN